MRTLLGVLVIVGAIVTLGILLVGVFGMAHDGPFNKKYGNILMRARVGAQFAVVILIFLYFMTAGD